MTAGSIVKTSGVGSGVGPTGADESDDVEMHPQTLSIPAPMRLMQVTGDSRPSNPSNSASRQVMGPSGNITMASGSPTRMPGPHSEQEGNGTVMGVLVGKDSGVGTGVTGAGVIGAEVTTGTVGGAVAAIVG